MLNEGPERGLKKKYFSGGPTINFFFTLQPNEQRKGKINWSIYQEMRFIWTSQTANLRSN